VALDAILQVFWNPERKIISAVTPPFDEYSALVMSYMRLKLMIRIPRMG